MSQAVKETKFMDALVDEFKEHVLLAMEEGHHLNFEDHYVFLAACLDNFIDAKNEEET